MPSEQLEARVGHLSTMLVISTDGDHVGAPAGRRALSPMLCLLPLIATVISDLYSETRGALLESNATTILVNRRLLFGAKAVGGGVQFYTDSLQLIGAGL
jgi:hypothetical protein